MAAPAISTDLVMIDARAEDEYIYAWQGFLQRQYPTKYEPVHPGKFDGETIMATRRYQREAGLPVDIQGRVLSSTIAQAYLDGWDGEQLPVRAREIKSGRWPKAALVLGAVLVAIGWAVSR